MFNLTFVSLAVGLAALIVASLFDIKTREVPDWLNYGLVAFGIGSALILSIYHGYSHIILNAVFGLIIGLAVGLLMFYTGQWGGGDSKLIIGLSTLIGLGVSELNQGIPILVIFFVNILLVGAIYGIIFSFIKAILNYKIFKQAVEKKLRSRKIIILRIILLVLGLGTFVYYLVARTTEASLVFLFALALFIFFYLWIFISTVEKTTMIKKVKVSELTEGDWIINPIVKLKGKKEQVILSPTKTGVTLKEIALLKENRIRNVVIKIGVPFVPSFLIAYVLTFTVGNWLVSLV